MALPLALLYAPRVTRAATFLLALLAFYALPACDKGPTTTIPVSWKNPNYQGEGFKKLFVIGVGEDDAARRLFEDTFAKALSYEGAAAQASWGHLPKSGQLTKEEIRYSLPMPRLSI